MNAVRSTCAEVTYKAAADYGESGCGDGPLERRSAMRLGELDGNITMPSLNKRLPPTDPDGADMMECNYKTDMCTGPRVISTYTQTPFLRTSMDE